MLWWYSYGGSLHYVSLGALISALSIFFLFGNRASFNPRLSFSGVGPPGQLLSIYIADLPREFNYGLLESYWKAQGENVGGGNGIPKYPENPLIRQYSAEYWLLGDLLEGGRSRGARRVVDTPEEADVIFVPFFAALSAEFQLETGRGHFRQRKAAENGDFQRQLNVVKRLQKSPRWLKSGGRDHVFVLTDPVAMFHMRSELANSILLVVDFGGWYMEDAKFNNTQNAVRHTQVSLIKDVIVPYTHLLPTLSLAEDAPRTKLLYFKGARYRHRTGLVRDQLWNVLDGEAGVVLETGFPNKTGQLEAMTGMRSSHFCLHPAGDTPSSCRLFDAIASLCIPVIVSDSIELPFEGMLDYTKFSLFVSVQDALKPRWLVQYLQGISPQKRDSLRQNMARVQNHFEFENDFPGGQGSARKNGAVDMIWKKVHSKVPGVREAVARERRRPANVGNVPGRCHCL